MLGIYDKSEQCLAVGNAKDILPFTDMTKKSLYSVISRIRKGQHSGHLKNGCMIAIIEERSRL